MINHRYMVQPSGSVSKKLDKLDIVAFPKIESKEVAAQHLHRTKYYRNHNTENNCGKHQTFTQPYFLGAISAEYQRNDNTGKNDNTDQQKYKYPLAELLTAHTLDAEVKLGRNFWV